MVEDNRGREEQGQHPEVKANPEAVLPATALIKKEILDLATSKLTDEPYRDDGRKTRSRRIEWDDSVIERVVSIEQFEDPKVFDGMAMIISMRDFNVRGAYDNYMFFEDPDDSIRAERSHHQPVSRPLNQYTEEGDPGVVTISSSFLDNLKQEHGAHWAAVAEERDLGLLDLTQQDAKDLKEILERG